jgi:predicted ester cyclase
MSTEDNKDIVRRFKEGFNEYIRTGNVDPLLETVHPDGAIDTPGLPPTPEGMKQVLPAFRSAFPDMHYTIVEMIADEDKVAYRTTWTGSSWACLPPASESR